MEWDRDFTYIKNKPVRHVTCMRDFVCRCGGQLTTRWFEDEPHWRTVCTADPTHGPDLFITKGKAEYLRHKSLMDAAVADDVFAHLPAALQAAIHGQ